MEESLRGGLSLCMSGFGFWAHDIGGFENTSTADVYKRWVAFGLLSSHSRLHGSQSYRVPWVYDDEAVDVVRFFTKLKAKLMPYIYKNAITASTEGIPVMRSMVLEFAEDKTCHYLDKQYMLGDSLLVAPIFNDEGKAEYYLPSGVWTNFFTGKEYKGGTWITETHDYLSIPLMVRENSIIVTGSHDDRADYDYADGCELRVYAIHDGIQIDTVVYGVNNVAELNVSVKRLGHSIHVTSDGSKPYSIRMINMQASNAVNGFLSLEGNDSVITPDKGAKMIEVTF
jgi:alpha-D-xyloside xylohydrolase